MSSLASFTVSATSAIPPRGFIDSVIMGIITSIIRLAGSGWVRPPMAAAMIAAIDFCDSDIIVIIRVMLCWACCA